MGSIAASLRKNPLHGVMALGERLSAANEAQRSAEEQQARRDRLRKLIQERSMQTVNEPTVEMMPRLDTEDAADIGDAGTVQENVIGMPGSFGGNAMQLPRLNDGGIKSRFERFRSTVQKEKPRMFDETDMADMYGEAGDDTAAQGMIDAARKANEIRAAKKKRNFDVQTIGEGGYDILEMFDDAPPERIGGRDPRPKEVKDDMTPYQRAMLKLREREVARGTGRDAAAGKQWVRSANGGILYKVPEEGDLPYKPSAANNAQFMKLKTRADKAQKEYDAIDNVLKTGTMIRQGKKVKLNLKDEGVKQLLDLQLEQADSALQSVYDEIYNLEDEGELPGAADAPAPGGAGTDSKRERVRKILQDNGLADDEENITTFIQNNPNI